MDLQALKTQLEAYGQVLVCEETIDLKAVQIVMENVSSDDLSTVEIAIDDNVADTYPVRDLFDSDVYLKVRYKK